MSERLKPLSIDRTAHQKFLERVKIRLGPPECILEEFCLTPPKPDSTSMTDHQEPEPLKQYQNAEGYRFNWGHILERRTQQYIVWDYCFDQLLIQYLRVGRRLSDLQRAVFYELERRLDCTTRDIVPVLSMEEGWKIIPCSSVGVFTQVVHFAQDKAAREWIVSTLLSETLPDVIAKLQNDATKPR